MRFVILAVGTRGDVQPLVALGRGLRQAGHHVRLATYPIFQELTESAGLEFFRLEGNSQEQLKQEEGQAMLAAGGSSARYMLHGIRLFRTYLERLLLDTWEACQGAEAIINPHNAIAGPHIAKRLGIPCYLAWFSPVYRTRAFPLPIGAADLHLGGTFNELTYIAAEQFAWHFLRRQINRWRKETLNLAPLPFRGPSLLPITNPYGRRSDCGPPLLYGYSPLVVPKPLDWPDRLHVTGYWFLDHASDWQPPARLADFLAAGPPPVYIGFGSMIDRDPEALTNAALEALKRTGQRGILLSGWSGLNSAHLPDEVLQVESVPHDWLFPHTAAVVHHGGAGTTATGLRAGVPSIIVPFAGDQPFWGKRIAELGVGPAPIPHKQLTAERLADAIRAAISDTGMRARVAALAERIRAEDGVAYTVEVIHRYLPQR